MDQDTIRELSKITDLLSIIVILLGLLVAGKLFESLGNVVNNWRSFRTTRVRATSLDMHERGDYNGLIEYLTKELESHPNCATSTYWIARGYLSLFDYEKAEKKFLKLKVLEPSWESEYVSPYLKEIAEKH